MEYQYSSTNVDPQDDHESEIITSDSATDFAAEHFPTTRPTSAPADALGSVNEEPINSAETLTDAIIKDRQLMLANLMEPYASQMATFSRSLAATLKPSDDLLTTFSRSLAATLKPSDDLLATFSRSLAATLKPSDDLLATFSRSLAATLKPSDDLLATFSRSLAATLKPSDDLLATFSRSLAATLKPSDDLLATFSRSLADLTNPYIEASRRGQLLEKHEWFPHYTMPESLFGGHIDDADFNALVLAYYRANWAEVRQLIEQNLSDCPADGETKAAFHEALDSHESGHYLSVCRNLIPELERIVRIHLYGDKVGSFSVDKQMNIYFGNLPVSVLPDRSLGWIGFKYLQSHLYAQIKDEADRERYVNHQIPNRHAAMHGLVTYDNVQNSLNSIFVADYVLQLITAWKALERNAILSV